MPNNSKEPKKPKCTHYPIQIAAEIVEQNLELEEGRRDLLFVGVVAGRERRKSKYKVEEGKE